VPFFFNISTAPACPTREMGRIRGRLPIWDRWNGGGDCRGDQAGRIESGHLIHHLRHRRNRGHIRWANRASQTFTPPRPLAGASGRGRPRTRRSASSDFPHPGHRWPSSTDITNLCERRLLMPGSTSSFATSRTPTTTQFTSWSTNRSQQSSSAHDNHRNGGGRVTYSWVANCPDRRLTSLRQARGLCLQQRNLRCLQGRGRQSPTRPRDLRPIRAMHVQYHDMLAKEAFVNFPPSAGECDGCKRSWGQ